MKAILGLFAVVVVVGVGAWNLHEDHQKAKIELISAERSIAQVKALLEDRKLHLETLKRHYEMQRRIYDTNLVLTEVQSVMQELQSEIESQKRVYQDIIENRRGNARGTVLGTVELAGGRILRDVKVLSFEDSTLAVLTSDGILRLRAQDLPPHLQDYFRFDIIEPELASADLSNVNPFESGLANGASKFVYTADAVSASGQPSGMNDITNELKVLNKRVQNLERAKQGPLIGMDSRLKPGSAVYRYRKKMRDDKLDREIAVLHARRQSFEKQRKEQLSKISSR